MTALNACRPGIFNLPHILPNMIKLLLPASTWAESSTATTITGGFIIHQDKQPPLPSAQRRERADTSDGDQFWEGIWFWWRIPTSCWCRRCTRGEWGRQCPQNTTSASDYSKFCRHGHITLFVDISLTEIKKLKVAELKSELQKHGLDTKGLKGALLGRVNWCHHE